MTRREQSVMLLRKAAADERLVEKALDDADVADELVGYHCQQAAEKLLKLPGHSALLARCAR
jgi:HEPN domain-containing protein